MPNKPEYGVVAAAIRRATDAQLATMILRGLAQLERRNKVRPELSWTGKQWALVIPRVGKKGKIRDGH
jgi:hypothetical protein